MCSDAAEPKEAQRRRRRRLVVLVFAGRCFVADAYSAPDWMVAVRAWAWVYWVHDVKHRGALRVKVREATCGNTRGDITHTHTHTLTHTHTHIPLAGTTAHTKSANGRGKVDLHSH